MNNRGVDFGDRLDRSCDRDFRKGVKVGVGVNVSSEVVRTVNRSSEAASARATRLRACFWDTRDRGPRSGGCFRIGAPGHDAGVRCGLNEAVSQNAWLLASRATEGTLRASAT